MLKNVDIKELNRRLAAFAVLLIWATHDHELMPLLALVGRVLFP